MSKPLGSNRLLDRLPPPDRDRLMSFMRPVKLDLKHVLFTYQAPIDCVYFPTSGTVSAVTIMEDGGSIEVATIGNEGVVGLNVLLAGKISTNEIIVQIAGEALLLEAEILEREAARSGPLLHILMLYQTAFLTQVSQSVACNGLHPILKRCCRWLLTTRDHMGSDVVPITHEFLAVMLGVRRPSITEVLRPLQELGLISSQRGAITILDSDGLEKQSCECYRKVRDAFDLLFGPERS